MSEETGNELNITVTVRCRGRNEREIKAKSSVVVTVPDITGSNQVSVNTTDDMGITGKMNSKTYVVDKVFGPSADQILIFKDIAEPLFQDFIKGYNCTMLVYGMTSTGKTYTMTGDERLINGQLTEMAGIIPRILFKLFETLNSRENDYIVKCSFLELYNEELKDLLCDLQETSSYKKLRIFDSNSANTINSTGSPTECEKGILSKKKIKHISLYRQHPMSQKRQKIDSNKTPSSAESSSIYIQHLQEFHITTAKEGIQLLQKGLKYRQVASTKMNDFSSRSHTIFTITLYKKYDDQLFRVSKMNLVDLAGSENINKSGAQNQRAKEAGLINQSLLTLGRVINSLADKNPHIPFRESKLTRLLQDSLGGNAKTALIATISPAKINFEETSSTLEYASKAKDIKNKPQLGSFIMKDILVKNLSAELSKVKADFLSTNSKDGVYLTMNHYKELMNDIEHYKTEIQEINRTVEKMNSQNSFLLKEKNNFQETNDLQRIKIQSLQLDIDHLHKEIENKRKKEFELVDHVEKLSTAIRAMQEHLNQQKHQQKEFQNRLNTIIKEQILFFRKEIDSRLITMKLQNSKIPLEYQVNVDEIEKYIERLFAFFFVECVDAINSTVEKLIEDQPKHLESVNSTISLLDHMLNAYISELNIGLSGIDKKCNNLKVYFNDHFLKNNHQKLLDAQMETICDQLQQLSNSLISKFTEMMQDHIDISKTVLTDNLQATTSKIIMNEIDNSKPIRLDLESSVEIINRCNSLNKNLESSMGEAINDLKTSIYNSLKNSNSVVHSTKQIIGKFEDSPNVLEIKSSINKKLKEIKNYQELLMDTSKNSVHDITNLTKIFCNIENDIEKLVDDCVQNISNSDKPNSFPEVSNSFQNLQKDNLTSLITPHKRPLLNYVNHDRTVKRSHSLSPIKDLKSNSLNLISPFRSKSEIFLENTPLNGQPK